MAGGLPPPAAAGGSGGLPPAGGGGGFGGLPAPRAGGGGGALRSALDAVLADTGENDSEMPPELLCPITLTLMADPVTTVDGMTYERYAIETWLQANNTSPLTGEPLPVKLLVPNTALRSQIQRYRETHASPGGSRTPGRAPGRAPARNGGARGY